MENTEQHLTDHSTAYDHSSDEFNFYLRASKFKKLLYKNELVIALELAIVVMLGGLAYLLMIN